MPTPSNLEVPFAPNISLDRESTVPLYNQIAEPLGQMITTGALLPGQLIEDEVSMANRLEVSRPTARRALQDLVSRGLLTRRRGAGTRVTPTHVRRPLSLTSLNEDLLKAGFTPTTEVVSYSVKLADEEAASHLSCAPGTEVIHIVRRRLVDDQPLALMTNVLAAAHAPRLTDLNSKGLYACLAEKGIRPVSAHQEIGARILRPSEAEPMAMRVGDPVLTMTRTAYDSEGTVIEYGTHIYNAELYSFRLTLTDGNATN
ncbi:GntR family transcriptional regulator [Schaalia vaccimaxillae]|uniref:GntR family transcriptional regulator n=1 Tax=Schaalia vaccimaxillae TaxID=183916 RepID=UPI0003B7362B|nr:GntR family transcriptional regulator [Schaalia vaccimaxillae]